MDRQRNPARPYRGFARAVDAALVPVRRPAAEIARLAGLSPSQTRRLFQKRLREGPRRWLIRERLIAAQSRIIRDDAPIASIAKSCGFCDVYHFGREFKRVVDASPAAWRQAKSGARQSPDGTARRASGRGVRSSYGVSSAEGTPARTNVSTSMLDGPMTAPTGNPPRTGGPATLKDAERLLSPMILYSWRT